MKRKTHAPRNPFVAAAKFKKAGAHGKTNKAKRRAEKMLDQGGLAERPGTRLLTGHTMGLNPSASTSKQSFEKSAHVFFAALKSNSGLALKVSALHC